MKFILLLSLIIFTFWLKAQDIKAFQIFDGSGKLVTFSDMAEKCAGADIVFFGEYHNDPIGHWLQYELTVFLFAKKGNALILGAEMFESDNQLIMDEYLQGLIPAKKFGDEARLWPNYDTDYKPLVDFAKVNRLPFIATNVPRRYASLVAKEGFEALEKLSAEAKALTAPLPVAYDENLNCYKSMLSMQGMGGHANANLPKAQAVKDATMSYFILKYFSKGKLFLHYNGSYHSDNHEGIVWYLKQRDKNLKIVVISSASQKNISELSDDNKEKGDFILCVPETMTKTH